MSAPRDDPGYARLLLLVGGIAADVKNILTRQDRQDHSIDKIEDRIIRLEAFRWKTAGVAVSVPVVLTALGFFIQGWL